LNEKLVFITFTPNGAIMPREPFSPLVIYLLNTWPGKGKQIVKLSKESHVVNA